MFSKPRHRVYILAQRDTEYIRHINTKQNTQYIHTHFFIYYTAPPHSKYFMFIIFSLFLLLISSPFQYISRLSLPPSKPTPSSLVISSRSPHKPPPTLIVYFLKSCGETLSMMHPMLGPYRSSLSPRLESQVKLGSIYHPHAFSSTQEVSRIQHMTRK